MIDVRSLGPDNALVFSVTYNTRSFAAGGAKLTFLQDDHSFSAATGVLRQLHYQLHPGVQAKLGPIVHGGYSA